MRRRRVCITETDMKQLREFLESTNGNLGRDSDNIRQLKEELDRAEVVSPEDLPSDAVTMSSRVLVEDMNCSARRSYELVYPHDADISKGRISVLAPIGTALLGYREGNAIEWHAPAGKKRVRILRVQHAPEAMGKVA